MPARIRPPSSSSPPTWRKPRDLLDRHRTAEEVALRLVATKRFEELPLLGGFNAFRRRGHAERIGDADDGLHDGYVLAAWPRSDTKVRSILILSNGKLRR